MNAELIEGQKNWVRFQSTLRRHKRENELRKRDERAGEAALQKVLDGARQLPVYEFSELTRYLYDGQSGKRSRALREGKAEVWAGVVVERG